MAFKPVSISKGSFAFCRYTMAIILWMAVVFNSPYFVITAFILLLLSALVGVQKAPLILLYKFTFDKIFPTKDEIVNEKGIRFAHSFGVFFAIVILSMHYYFKIPNVAQILTVIFALFITIAAFGFCSALKLYNCLDSRTCCRLGKKIKGKKSD